MLEQSISVQDDRDSAREDMKQDNATESISKVKKRDVIKSVFTLGPIVTTSNQSDHSHSVEEQTQLQRQYEYLQNGNPEEWEKKLKAIILIQSYFRGWKDRKLVNGMKLNRDARWDDLVKRTGEITYANEQLDNKNDVRSRWHRAVQAAARLEKGEGVFNPPKSLIEEIPVSELSEKDRKARKATFWGALSMGIGKGNSAGQGKENGKERDESQVLPFQSKALEQQHWLEMIDGKHRYGSNMKYYFRKWKEAETQDNFFRWLDRGDGKDLDLEEMPRERFERERITYLSAEQRLNYLIKVDKNGLLRWARNNELVDTAAGKWKDAGNGNGIISDDTNNSIDSDEDNHNEISGRHAYASTSKTPWNGKHRHKPVSPNASSTDSLSSDSYSAGSDLDDNEDTHYVGIDKSDKGWLESRKNKLTPGGMRKELLRKTVRRNTWIYVCDMKLNLFVGIKQSGTFQHSSLLAGGKVTSAGIIVVKHGLIKSLNPLSGHYRSSIEHYRAFIGQLEGRGVDLSHIKIAKSVLSLWGLSKYAQVTKREQSILTHIRRALHLSHEATEEEKSAALQENAEKEEKEHQERMKAVHEAEEQSGIQDKGDESDKEEIRRIRREVLYGKEKQREDEQRKHDTEDEVPPI
ncbi:uncharacterized protein IL334_002567 [Kwoniella shivajii]|uniref:IQ domain-containing calmodulin-binding protein n=1 Tax=Kwoniella shivajii TaxID=564305 RepID=A0ABZ1CZA5_9TREE|nr:hypothetical protein IL334_002567 [Kwoniella shivajii]